MLLWLKALHILAVIAWLAAASAAITAPARRLRAADHHDELG